MSCATSPSRGYGDGALWVAVLRLALLPLVAVGRVAVDHPGRDSPAFGPLWAATLVYALLLLAVHGSAARRRRPPPRWLVRAEPVADLAAIAALTYTSGGPYSETRLAFFVLPVVAAFRLRPLLTVAWTAAAIAVYVLLSLPHPATRSSTDIDAIAVHALFLAWAGAAATVLAALLGERDRRLREAADDRGRLIAQTLTAEERERRRLAEALHDDAIQNLLVARQDLRDYRRRGDEESYARADAALDITVDQLRGEISRLHPYVLDHAGLRAALTGHAEQAARQAGARADVEIDDDDVDPQRQGLVLAIARELLANAGRHSAAGVIRLRLTSEDGDGLVLVVADDGRGLDPDRRAAALSEGHIGMATAAERAAAVGGTLDVATAPGAGTTVTVRLPRAS